MQKYFTFQVRAQLNNKYIYIYIYVLVYKAQTKLRLKLKDEQQTHIVAENEGRKWVQLEVGAMTAHGRWVLPSAKINLDC